MQRRHSRKCTNGYVSIAILRMAISFHLKHRQVTTSQCSLGEIAYNKTLESHKFIWHTHNDSTWADRPNTKCKSNSSVYLLTKQNMDWFILKCNKASDNDYIINLLLKVNYQSWGRPSPTIVCTYQRNILLF
jgi:hypothetical protein